ncbi:MAG: hypothetical protein ACFCBV_01445 [Phycisphaerales bacterium]
MPDAILEVSEAVVVKPPTIEGESETIFGIPKIASDKRYPGVERLILAVWPRELGGVWKWGRA